MSDSSNPPQAPAPIAQDVMAPTHVVTLPRRWAIAVALVAGIAVLVSGLLWQKLGNIQQELARRSLESGAQSIEARTLAKAAQDSTRELAARLALQENRISEVSLQRTQLEELMQSLSRSRDENLVVDIESAIRLAQQQAQLTGSAVPLIAALTSASQRLQRAAQPRLNPLQRALTNDMERIKSASLTDVPVLMIKIDELTRMADELPVANGMNVNSAARQSAAITALSANGSANTSANAPAPATRTTSTTLGSDSAARPLVWGWFDSQRIQAAVSATVLAVRDEAHKLLRVSRIEQPEAALLSPEQSFFLRENFKLRLLNARLGLLSRQTDIARADLLSAGVWLGKYFDPNARKTEAASQLLQQIQSQLKTSELPRLDETMAALATAAAGR